MTIWDGLLLAAILIIIIIIGFIIRRRLLNLWMDVSEFEVQFYRQIERTMEVYLTHQNLFDDSETKTSFKLLKKYRRYKVRKLFLRQRQDIYSALRNLYSFVEDHDDMAFKPLKSAFRSLQKTRRIYNSKVLLYNQRINIFPTHYLAIKLELEAKEYFG
ncbi:MAG: LemA family protein [Candidatus Izimaplasma sp.]|nr:LemA family protein [Candidatus Izimaplasma bacterium]